QVVELAVANALWGEKTMPFKPAFLAAMNRHYGAGLFPSDFTGNAEAERKRINQWVEKQTRDKIKDVLPRGVIDNMTRLVLTNAIYFKGDWQTQFKESMTRPQPFNTGEGKSVQVPLMFLPRGRFPYHQNKDVQLLELPYRGEDLSMLVLLPTKSPGGLAGLEKKLSSKQLAGWIAGARRQPVNVFLPRFKLETQYDLKPPLKALGMKDAFVYGRADFTGLSESEKLYISAVLHKAFVEVNEEGTEAAAATAVVVATKSAKPRIPTFRADRPFVFLIRDRSSGSILFLGRVTNPKA
ncbi:MAG: serpin family protein, partial [Phycisphaerae bacterium]|nr:serpin family protein [Phycisphaerae bacterium]